MNQELPLIHKFSIQLCKRLFHAEEVEISQDILEDKNSFSSMRFANVDMLAEYA